MRNIYPHLLLTLLFVVSIVFLFYAEPKVPALKGDPARKCGPIYIEIKGTQYPVYKDGVQLAYCKGDTAFTNAKP